VHRAADLLVEEDVAREAVDRLVEAEGDLPRERDPASVSSRASSSACPRAADAATTRPAWKVRRTSSTTLPR